MSAQVTIVIVVITTITTITTTTTTTTTISTGMMVICLNIIMWAQLEWLTTPSLFSSPMLFHIGCCKEQRLIIRIQIWIRNRYTINIRWLLHWTKVEQEYEKQWISNRFSLPVILKKTIRRRASFSRCPTQYPASTTSCSQELSLPGWRSEQDEGFNVVIIIIFFIIWLIIIITGGARWIIPLQRRGWGGGKSYQHISTGEIRLCDCYCQFVHQSQSTPKEENRIKTFQKVTPDPITWLWCQHQCKLLTIWWKNRQ